MCRIYWADTNSVHVTFDSGMALTLTLSKVTETSALHGISMRWICVCEIFSNQGLYMYIN